MKTLTVLFVLFTLNVNAQQYYTWKDSNGDGCADGWKCPIGQPSIITNRDYLSNAQQVIGYFELFTTPTYQQEGRKLIQFTYMCDVPVALWVHIDANTIMYLDDIPPSPNYPSKYQQEYWVPSQYKISFVNKEEKGWLQLDNVFMYKAYSDSIVINKNDAVNSVLKYLKQ